MANAMFYSWQKLLCSKELRQVLVFLGRVRRFMCNSLVFLLVDSAVGSQPLYEEMHMHKNEDDEHKDKKVKILVDSHPKHLSPGQYLVSDLKIAVDVPAEKELDLVVNGALTPLADTATIVVAEGEVFFSHVRRGGSS
jgi:hypothetical protein